MGRIGKIYKKKDECCGCAACAQICPHNAIHMCEDNEGFSYPQIDKTKCVGCGLCKNVCPIINAPEKNDEVKKCYIAYCKNEEIRLNSSSGGIFTVLAEKILEQDGIVIGAAFDDNWMVKHICVSNKGDLAKLRGSKYVQSDTNEVFKQAKNYLQEGKKVLFSGTECQVSGLKAFLNKEYENLFTVDVLCHGVPSPKVWDKYVREKDTYKDAKIENINMRNKDVGWKNFSVKITYEDSTTNREVYHKNEYMNLFLSNICLRPSCYNCKFKRLQRNSDVTIGDCWGIENYMPDMDDDKGSSVVMIHTDKGEQLWKSIESKLCYKEAKKDKALSPMADSRKSVEAHINRKPLFKLINKNKTVKELVNKIDVSFFERVKRKGRNIIKKLS